MKILIIGGGGREHALAWKLCRCPGVEAIIASPGNPGIGQIGKCFSAPPNLDGYVHLAEREKVSLTVVGPEAPLVSGVVDLFRSRGLKIVGPTQAAARLEGSKIFAKAFFSKAGIPTARSSPNWRDFGFPMVVKADGLAAGKGVIIAANEAEIRAATAHLGPNILIEEFLQGEEVSFIAISDGTRILPFAATQDHKRAYDGDQGPNTGGMGAYCDSTIISERHVGVVMDTIMTPAIYQMAQDGNPFTGFLYAGLMMTVEGPKVLEFNVRMGDPETQALMVSLRDSDLAEVLQLASNGALPTEGLAFGRPATCVVLAAPGYPERPVTGQVIQGLEQVDERTVVFQAGTAMQNGNLVASGGRVLGVTASGSSLKDSVDAAYRGVAAIHFDGMHFRQDIGKRGMARIANSRL